MLIEWLSHISFWVWFGVGLFCLIIEVFGTGGYFLWIGISAGTVGLLKWLFPNLSWEFQLIIFSLIALISAYSWWRYLKHKPSLPNQSNLNQRSQQLLGRCYVVSEAIVGGHGKIKVGDSFWMVTGPDLPAGVQVKVVAVNGMQLQVEAIERQNNADDMQEKKVTD
ncbi:NfeD family protein [Zooshikella harenae]|uniref:NfeD family protein n=1 Tax=Zooshikella harenae TaxID=2827238 RepID=A0ABS5ZA93_9GAMM|nr:NfeD family protein [Zooshikella harenae]MBU2710673.1 NfeD family protein [Zooshikella harenae]